MKVDTPLNKETKSCKIYSERINSEVAFTKIEKNEEWNVSFLQNTPLTIQHTYSCQFSIDRTTFETSLFIWCEAVLMYLI